MEYRKLGRAGLKVSAVGIGTNQIGSKVDLETTIRIIHRALDLGVNLIDTADNYADGRSEEYLGKVLKGNWDRVVLATKVGGLPMGDGPNDDGASRYHIAYGLEASLRRLQVDHIDLYQIHRWDPNTPIEETLRALDDFVRAGKVRYIGASNFAAWQLCRANDVAELLNLTPFVSIQPHYNMLHREIEKEMMPYAQAFNLGILPYFPLAGGFLTGKYRRGHVPPGSRGREDKRVQAHFTDGSYTLIEKLKAFAEGHGRTMVQLAIAWLLAQPQVSSVISGVTGVDHLENNVKAHDWHLGAGELNQISDLLGGK